MKRLTAAALSFILMVGCGAKAASPRLSEEQMTEVQRPRAPEPVIDSENSIIYRERIYNGSDTKSDLMIQSNGSVWYGIYMRDEGRIDRFNHLWKNEDECIENYRLADDEWLAAMLSETKEDDFVLFGETEQIVTLPEESISSLYSLVSAADPFSASNFRTDSADEPEADDIQTEYHFIDLIIADKICRAYENTQGYESMVQDQNAAEVIQQIHESSYYSKWLEICKEKLISDTDQ